MEDYECFAKLSRVGPAAYLDCELAEMTDHEGPRLTDLADVEQMMRRVRLLERVWGSDQLFLDTYSDRYFQLLSSKVKETARRMLGSGQFREARELLKSYGGPFSYRMIANLPPALVRNILGVRRQTRRLLSKSA